MLDFKVSQFSDKGKLKPRGKNQDDKYVNSGGNLIVVADGNSDCEDGRLASNLAVLTVRHELGSLARDVKVSGNEDPEQILGSMEASVEKANERLLAYDGDLSTTIDVCLLDPFSGIGYGAHVGDGSVYLFTPKEGLKKLTKDHSERRDGTPFEEGLKLFAGGIRLSRYLGMSPEDGQVTPDLYRFNLIPGSVVLAATDGMTTLVSEREICSVLRKFDRTDYSVARELANIANYPQDIARLYAHEKGTSLSDAREKIGGRDNITVVAVKVYNKE